MSVFQNSLDQNVRGQANLRPDLNKAKPPLPPGAHPADFNPIDSAEANNNHQEPPTKRAVASEGRQRNFIYNHAYLDEESPRTKKRNLRIQRQEEERKDLQRMQACFPFEDPKK